MIYSDTTVEYQLEDLSILGITLPIPRGMGNVMPKILKSSN